MPLRHPASPRPHPLFARVYARASTLAERQPALPALRRELLHGVTGRVIEIGAGNGLNFAHYPRAVSEVVAVEPERSLRRLATDAALRSEVPVDVVPGFAEALPVKSEAFDAAVACLVLCSVRDLPRSLAELHRVLRPDAELRFFEHGRAPTPAMAAFQRTLDRTVWPHLFGGCHTFRDPVAAIRAAGFRSVSYRTFRLPESGPAFPTSYCVIGSARRAPG
ncbi:class I SAM-dependent methyltransferase [Streptomyces sp. NPDC006430]|uniref:class I SAM-dependent methyltransferase n=1 Tax=Streptomyces sp. NPDC006430 TaxID=3154299 RepID=UPI0033B02D2C